MRRALPGKTGRFLRSGFQLDAPWGIVALKVVKRFDHERLAARRAERGMSQERAAEVLLIDVRTYRRYERGEVNRGGFSLNRYDTRQLVNRMCLLFDLTVDDLVGEARGPSTGDDVLRAGDPGPLCTHPRVLEARRAERLPQWSVEGNVRVVHALQRALHFVGRAAELSTLRAWAEAPRPEARVRCIVGPGGAGKSALTERLIATLTPPRTGGLFVWSFYHGSVDHFFIELLRYLRRGRADECGGVNEIVRRLAGDETYVLVLDGVEAVQSLGDDEHAFGALLEPSLKQLLQFVAGQPIASRILVTSRVRLTDLDEWEGAGVEVMRIPPLSRTESAEVLRRWRVTDDDLDPVLDRFEGHALSLAMIGSYVGRHLGGRLPPGLRSSDLATDPIGRRLARLLRDYRMVLSGSDARWLEWLVALSPRSSVPAMLKLARQEGLRTVDAQLQAERAMAHLRELGLVFQVSPGVYSAHPFVREHFGAGEALAPPMSWTAARCDARRRKGSAARRALRTRKLRLFDLIDAGQPDAAYAFYRCHLGFARLGERMGRWWLGQRLMKAFTDDGTPHEFSARLDGYQQGQLLEDWTRYADRFGDLETGLECGRALCRLAERLDPRWQARALRHVAHGLRSMGRIEEAEAACRESVARAERHDLTKERTASMALGALILHGRGAADEAAEWLCILWRTCRELWKRPGLWVAELRLAMGAMAPTIAGQPSVVEALTRNAETCRRLRLKSTAACCEVMLGYAHAAGDPERARLHLEAARRWVERSREAPLRARWNALASRLIALTSERSVA